MPLTNEHDPPSSSLALQRGCFGAAARGPSPERGRLSGLLPEAQADPHPHLRADQAQAVVHHLVEQPVL
jgi:hypothetical protein